jgi:hypothetical protein
MALFSAIEASRRQNFVGAESELSFKPRIKGNHELKRLDCSVNYDKKEGHSNRGKGKGRGSNCSL